MSVCFDRNANSKHIVINEEIIPYPNPIHASPADMAFVHNTPIRSIKGRITVVARASMKERKPLVLWWVRKQCKDMPVPTCNKQYVDGGTYMLAAMASALRACTRSTTYKADGLST